MWNPLIITRMPNQDLTVKYAYRISFCFVLYNEPKRVLQDLFGINLFYTTHSGQIISCHVKDVKMFQFY